MKSFRRSLSLLSLLGLLGTAPLAAQGVVTTDPRITRLVLEVSDARLGQIIGRLSGFETRHAMSSTDTPDRGIGAAREWILQEMRSYSPRLQVAFDQHVAPQGGRVTRPTDMWNVMAVLPGRSARRVYVSGHYDTVARGEAGDFTLRGPNDNYAPGANDDGSGTALTMELARVFSQSGIEFDATLVFIAFTGEELGLVGAELHARKARAEDVRIDAIFNNDIVGNIRGGAGALDSTSIRVFSEGPEDSPSRQLARFIQRHGQAYVPGHRVRLIAREDRFGRGGDHTPFNRLGFTAVRFTESKENYERQHTVRDTPDGVNPRYLAQNARVNVGAVATLALAPPAPVVLNAQGAPTLGRGDSGYDAHLRWEASPGAVGYRIFWREVWTPDWEQTVAVGAVTEHLVPALSIDDYVFGVAAVGPDGHESLVSVYVRPPRQLAGTTN